MKQKPAASDVTTMLIQANGMQFVADVGGPATGELVVMLHGFPQTRYTWRRELSHLAAHGYRVCAYDQRGYSPGARPEGIDPYAVEFLVNDVLAVVETLGYEKFHLVGHDWGGGVAWATALLNEVRVLSLSIISRPHPRAFGRALKEDPEQSNRSRHHKNNRRSEATQEALADEAQRLRDSFKRSGVPDEDAATYLETLNNFECLDSAINWYRALSLSGDLFRSLGSCKIPTLYVWGNKDRSVGRYAAELTEQYVDAPYQFVELDGVGHFVTDQEPGTFPPLLLEHVRANPM